MKWSKLKSKCDIRWSTIRSIADIRFVRSMYVWIFIVPVLVKTLSEVEDVANVEVFGYSFQLITELPFSWQVFFFSAFLFVVENAIYYFHCPSIVRDHSNFADFRASSKGKYQLIMYSLQLEFPWDEVLEKVEQIDYAIDEDNSFSISSFDGTVGPEKAMRDSFWVVMDKAEGFKPRARRMAFGCYALAGTLLTIVLLQNLYTVLIYSIKSAV